MTDKRTKESRLSEAVTPFPNEVIVHRDTAGSNNYESGVEE